MTEPPQSGAMFALASAPARLASRLRPNLAGAIDEDARFYRGRTWLFALLALIAIAYPLGASIFRAVADPMPAFNSDLELSLFPLFFRVYFESLPFVLAMFAVGIFSPTLGVLMLALFLPEDIVASANAHSPGAQLIPLELSVLARILAFGVLWIGVIEIPLGVRRWVAVRQARSQVSRPPWRAALVVAIGTGLLAYVWANAVPWLIQPVHSWTVQGGNGSMEPLEMLFVGFYFSWILVLGVVLLAFVAAVLRGPEPDLVRGLTAAPPAFMRGRAGDVVTVIVLGFLASGLFYRPDTVIEQNWDVVQAILILGSLIVAGPVMTRLMPRLPAPRWLVARSTTFRWLLALAISAGGTYLLAMLVPTGTLPDYLFIAILVAGAVLSFRYIADAGSSDAAAAPGPAAAGAIVAGLFAIAVWLTLPMAVQANDGGEYGTPNGYAGPLGLLGGAAGAAGAMAKRKGGSQNDPSNPQPIKRPPMNPTPKPPPPKPPKPFGQQKPPPPKDPSMLDQIKDFFGL